MDLIIPTNLVCVLFGPAIPTSSFNFFILIAISAASNNDGTLQRKLERND